MMAGLYAAGRGSGGMGEGGCERSNMGPGLEVRGGGGNDSYTAKNRSDMNRVGPWF